MKLNSPAIQPAWYITADGRLEMDKLLKEFQKFFREHSESWVERFDYKEAGPQLLMQAFLQRIINGGEQRVVIALKLLQKSLAETIEAGVAQTWEYLDRSGAEVGNLVIFDRQAEVSCEEKLFVREEEYRGKPIRVWGM